MKLRVDFSSLFNTVKKMGVEDFVPFSIDFNSKSIEIALTPLSSIKGIEVPINDVVIGQNGTFTYDGQHVVLFIPDHSFKYDDVMINSRIHGNKFHLTDCQTLEKMKISKRFTRYFATTNRSGVFHIFNTLGDEADVELSVCKHCLSKLNYKNYDLNRTMVFNQFNLEEFFEHYDTNFRVIPKEVGQANGGYTQDWRHISKQYRESKHYCCEQCGVNLKQYPHLLDVHHLDGVKQHNSFYNLKAVCRLCHMEEDLHQHMTISQEDENLIKALRKNNLNPI